MIFRVSCKLPYQALNSFHFPIVKADCNRCITCLWIIAIQSRNLIDAAHTCYFLSPQGFGPEAKTRGGILGFPACVHIRNFKM